MWRHHWIIAWRHLLRHKGYLFLNLFGLTLGITASLIMVLYVYREVSYESTHANADRIYRLGSHIEEPDNQFDWSFAQIGLAPTLKADFPEVELACRVMGNSEIRMIDGEKAFTIKKFFYTDSTFNHIFTYDMLLGDKDHLLTKPNELVMSRTQADIIFGAGSNPVGKVLKSEEGENWQVSGVYADQPKTTHLQPDAIGSIITLPFAREVTADSWGNFGIYNYVMLHDPADAGALAGKLPEFVKKYVAVIFDQFHINIEYRLDPIKKIHLYTDYQGEPEPVGKAEYVYIFAIVAIFVLLIAIINYVNLATARASNRAREVGIRKVLGAERGKMIVQFLAESTLISIMALVSSLLLISFLIPLLNKTLEMDLHPRDLLQPWSLLALVGVVVLAGIGGGIYPAFMMSSFRPVDVLKGRPGGRKRDYLRMGLVSFQFLVTIFMLVATGVVSDQLRFVRNKDLGFDREHVYVIRFTDDSQREKWPVLKAKLAEIPGVISSGTSTSTPGTGFNKQLYSIESNEGVMENKGVDNYYVDYDFFESVDVHIIKGRALKREYSTDSATAVLVNEAMVTRMGWENPIGKKVTIGVDDSLPVRQVVGVVKNFHQRSLYNPIDALMFIPGENLTFAHVRMDGKDITGTTSKIAAAWNELFPTLPIESFYVGEKLEEDYKEDEKRGLIFTLFSGLTAIIACLGLLGLASFMANQRNREIGIRKVLGASQENIVMLLSREFLVLTSIAVIPAFALAAWYLHGWLEKFEYRTALKPLTFLLAALVALALTLAATSYHAIQASRNDPTVSLRNE